MSFELSFAEFVPLLDGIFTLLLSPEDVVVVDNETVVLSEDLKQKISEFCVFLRKTEWYKQSLPELNSFFESDSEKTVANVLRVIFGLMNEFDDMFLIYMSIITWLPVLDDCLKGV